MDKQILLHKKFIQAEIVHIESLKDRKLRHHAAEDLLRFHIAKIREFQHERQIHLVITLFFAALMLFAWFGFAAAYVQIGNFDLRLWPSLLLVLILTVLEAFYIRYYYNLENRTQKLYKLTDEIYHLMRFLI